VSEIGKRTISGGILVAVMLLCILGGSISFLAFFLLLIIGALWEFYGMFFVVNIKPQRWSGIVITGILFLLSFFISAGLISSEWYLLVIPSFLYIVISELFRVNDKPFENIAATVLGIIYIGLPVCLLWPIAYRDNIYQFNSHLVLGYFILIWTYDTFAYLIGKQFGKRRLLERVSPKKSWEGAIGGLLVSFVTAVVIAHFFTDLSLFQWLVFALITTIFGTLGDLSESMLKRSIGVKDSGNILPGHGGVMDRFDALFLAIPALYIYLQLI